MKRRLPIVLLAVLALALAVPAVPADDGGGSGEVAVGAHVVRARNSRNKAAEYQVDSSSAAFSAWFDAGFGGDTSLSLDMELLDPDDQRHHLELVAAHAFTFEADMNRFVHNLPHDPLENLAATDEHGKVVRHDDMDPGARYRYRFEDDHARLAWRPVNNRAWEFALLARHMRRSGSHQQLSAGHCRTCHIVGQSASVDQTMDDVTLRVAYLKSNWGVRYEYTSSNFDADADPVRRVFEQVLHPTKKVPVFDNRASFGIGGPVTLPVGLVPGHDRDAHVLHLFWTGEHDHLDAAAAYQKAESDHTGLRAKYYSFRARWLHVLDEAHSFSLRGRLENVDTDDVFVDVVEYPGSAGPQAGLYYRDVYADRDVEIDWTRRSAADRTVVSAAGEYVWRFGEHRRHRLKTSLRYRDIDRDNFRVDNGGGTNTREYTLRTQLLGRFENGARYRVEAEWYQASDPFRNLKGGCLAVGEDPTLVADPANFPWSSLQYFELHRRRIADLSNRPTDRIALRTRLTLVPSEQTTLTLHGKWLSEQNDQTRVSDWTHDVAEVGASLWWTPNERFYTTVTGVLLREDQETHLCIPLMNG